jgi:DNA-binding LacI/PurR family transcriptional regulator
MVWGAEETYMDMRDIAKIAGVSSATVSRVINGSNRVRPTTADRVRRVINELKFFPNNNATTLKYGRSSTYGLIIPDITNPFFAEFIKCFEKILVESNQEMLMATTDFHPTRIQQSVRRMLVRKVDGVALLASEIETESIESMIHNRVPLVTMDRRMVGPGLSDVVINNTSGMEQAIEHLKELRHTKIGYIGGSSMITISDHRANAFVRVMKKFGLAVNPDFMRMGNYRVSGGEAAMTELLRMGDRPTAILTANDLTAIGALRVLRQHGYAVPQDFSVIGFDDIELSDIIFPPLTTLRLPRYEFAETFFHALENAKKEPNAVGAKYPVSTSLVIRSSTGPAPSETSKVRKISRERVYKKSASL